MKKFFLYLLRAAGVALYDMLITWELKSDLIIFLETFYYTGLLLAFNIVTMVSR